MKRNICMEDEVRVLKAYTDFYNKNTNITREELYRDYFNERTYKLEMEKGTLDKYLVRDFRMA